MTTGPLTSTVAATLALCLLMITGCSSADEAEDAPRAGADGPSAEGMHGRLLHRLSPHEGHHVEFWEFAGRVLGVRELRPVDQTPLLTQDKLRQAARMSDLFALLSPGEGVPARIRDAELGQLPPLRDARSLNPPEGPSAAEASSLALVNQASGCGFDQDNDNFSTHWFISLFDLTAFPRTNWSRLNYQSLVGPRILGDWFQWSVMAAETVAGATAYVEWQFPGNDKQLLVEAAPIPPRTVEHFAFEGRGYYQGWGIGDASCPRIHAMAVWR